MVVSERGAGLTNRHAFQGTHNKRSRYQEILNSAQKREEKEKKNALRKCAIEPRTCAHVMACLSVMDRVARQSFHRTMLLTEEVA